MSTDAIDASARRRLLVLVSIAFALDWTFYSAVTPLIPDLQREMGLTDAATGIFVASYALGLLGSALAAGWVTARIGARTALVASLVMFAAVTVLFGLADTVAGLDLARGLQGVASAVTWAAGLAWLLAANPEDRHGLLIGTTTSASMVGGLIGPLLGASAVHLGRPVIFSLVGAGAVFLALLLRAVPVPPREGDIRPLAALRVLADGAGALAAWVILLIAAITGAMVVLAPLRLDRLGLGSTDIAVVFLVVALIEIVIGPPVGRFTDRDGPRRPMLLALILTTALSGALAAVSSLVPAIVSIGLLLPCALAAITPAYVVLGGLATDRGVAVAGLLAAGNLAWAAGESGGALSAGWLEDGGVATAGYIGMALLALATSVVLFLTRSPLLSGRTPIAADQTHPVGGRGASR
ncbi:MAG: MFS transporter [Actinobacteria bacterium]|nr:MFS transporter [Actinomycetota bacterium]